MPAMSGLLVRCGGACERDSRKVSMVQSVTEIFRIGVIPKRYPFGMRFARTGEGRSVPERTVCLGVRFPSVGRPQSRYGRRLRGSRPSVPKSGPRAHGRHVARFRAIVHPFGILASRNRSPAHRPVGSRTVPGRFGELTGKPEPFRPVARPQSRHGARAGKAVNMPDYSLHRLEQRGGDSPRSRRSAHR